MRKIGITTLIAGVLTLTGCETLPVNLGAAPSKQTTVAYVAERKKNMCVSQDQYPETVIKLVSKYSRSDEKLTVEEYGVIGNAWGVYMSEEAQLKSNINNEPNVYFSCFLFGDSFGRGLSFDYFGIHRDMKKSFQAGFREGYGERNSDLVMGVNLNQAAELKSKDSAIRLMDVYREKIIADVLATSRFKKDWSDIMDETLRTFEEITAEGSPAESRAFLSSFPAQYEKELVVLTACLERKNACDLRPDAVKRRTDSLIPMSDINEMLEVGFSKSTKEVKVLNRGMNYGVMTVHINDKDRPENTYFKYSSSRKKNQSSALMLADSNVSNQILHGDGLVEQVNKISWLFVGQEMGRKFNHNLISRSELIEWIKRARSIMESKSGDNYYDTSIRLLRDGFRGDAGYGAGGKKEWERLKKETNLNI
ncbi:MAG: hypothetical protein ACI9WC_003597 [Arenicella sp.]|jgi:hypothetical protein